MPVSQSQNSSKTHVTGFHGAFRQSMSWLHTWVGLVLAVVLYFMFVTGTTGYVQKEITRWMEPERGKISAVNADLAIPHSSEAMAEAAFAHAFKDTKEWKAVYLGWPVKGSTEDAYYAFGEGHPPAKEGDAAPSLDVKFDAKTLALKGEGPAVRETGGGAALYRMHYSLHYMPENPIQVGSYSIALPTLIVGAATMFMLVAIATGIVVHKKIFADFFTFRPGKGQRSWLDAHNLSSVLALPFMIAITYSGLVFYTYEYMPSIKAATYGLDGQATERLDADQGHLFALVKLERSGQPASIVSPSVVIAKARDIWGALEPQWIDYYNPGDANGRVVVWSTAKSRELAVEQFETLVFDGVSGALLQKPALTQATNPARATGDILMAIHEGHFAGPVLRWLLLMMGSLGAAVIASGLVLWTKKRKQKLKIGEKADLGIEFVDRTNVGVIAGLLLAVGVYFWANRLLPVGMEGRAAWEIHCLFIAWGLAMLHSLLRPSSKSWAEQFSVAAVIFGFLPVLNALTTDIHLGKTLFVPPAEQDLGLASFDLVAVGLGVIFTVLAKRAWARRLATSSQEATSQTQLVMEAAE